MTQTEIDRIQKSIKNYSKYFGPEWSGFLAPFLASREYYEIGQYILQQKKEKIPLTPDLKEIFRAFKECPLLGLHTVIVGQDPYSNTTKGGELVADGIAFSAKNCTTPPPSLEMLLEALDVSVYDGEYGPTQVYSDEKGQGVWDLKLWANQGILMLNCALTTVVGRPNEHINLWRPFVSHILGELNKRKDALGVVLIGSHAKELAPIFTNKTYKVLTCEHPARAMRLGRSWQHNNVFKDLTEFHKKSNNIKINW